MLKKEKRVTVILFSLIISIPCCVVFGVKLFSFNQQRIEFRKAEIIKENAVLQEVSQRTGMEFRDWPSLREYVYCQMLHEGMSRTEVEAALSTIGEIYPFKNISNAESTSFKDNDLESHMSPMILVFTGNGSTAKLVEWRRSYEYWASIPPASCEK